MGSTGDLKHADFFFQKHCIVAKFLETRPPENIIFVLDADVVAAVLERGLEQWARFEGDVHLYHRAANREIAAGNYMVRNAPWARKFLHAWCDFHKRQPSGFSSSDNGAIHVHILETLDLEDAPRCAAMYHNLVEAVEVAMKNNGSYWNFVECCVQALGPPRQWRVASKNGDGGGFLTIWPRNHFCVMDGMYTNFFASNDLGAILHHGIKDDSVLRKTYYSNLDRCQLRHDTLHQSREAYGLQMLHFGRAYPEFYPPGDKCSQCVERCMRTLTCRPLANNDDPKPHRTCKDCN